MEQGLSTATMCVDEFLKNSSIPDNELHRSREITNRLLEKINIVTAAKNSDMFLKKGDIVHCTVTGVNQSFIYVSIKTDDSRNVGSIHISKLTGKYIGDLKNEVEIGQIFQAKIINDDFFKSEWGWELAKHI